MRLSIFIPGGPVAQPRPRFNRKTGAVYTPKGAPISKWRKILLEALERRVPDDQPEGNVILSIEFNIARPKKHYGTGCNCDVLKSTAPDAHTQKPDLDNLVKPVIDEMVNAGWMRDDSMVDEMHVCKYWCIGATVGDDPANSPGVEIEMRYD